MAGKQVRNNTSEPKEHGNGGKSTDKKDKELHLAGAGVCTEMG